MQSRAERYVLTQAGRFLADSVAEAGRRSTEQDHRLMKTALGTLLFILALAAGAAAATIVVDNTVDPGDGICSSPGCTPREAINAANINPGADTITFNIAPPGSANNHADEHPCPIIHRDGDDRRL